jgi:hypothetical protein
MKNRPCKRQRDAAAELKLLIIQQQEKAAKLARAGKAAAARAARSKLLVLLNQLELSQSLLVEQAVDGGGQQEHKPKIDQQEAAH